MSLIHRSKAPMSLIHRSKAPMARQPGQRAVGQGKHACTKEHTCNMQHACSTHQAVQCENKRQSATCMQHMSHAAHARRNIHATPMQHTRHIHATPMQHTCNLYVTSVATPMPSMRGSIPETIARMAQTLLSQCLEPLRPSHTCACCCHASTHSCSTFLVQSIWY